MKSSKLSFVILILSFFSVLSGFSQSEDNVLIGKIKDKSLSITNHKFISQLFYSELDESGIIGIFDVQYDPDGKLVFVSSRVTGNNDNVNSIGVSLIIKGDDAYYVRVSKNEEDLFNKISKLNTCRSVKCNSCNLVVSSWKPFGARCEKGGQNDKECDCSHSVKMTMKQDIELKDNSEFKEKSKLKKFKFIIEKQGDKVILKSKKGFTWKALSYSSVDNSPATITKTGVTVSSYENSKEKSPIIFTIEKTPNGFYLRGIKGTAWTFLNLICENENCRQEIDQKGIIKK